MDDVGDASGSERRRIIPGQVLVLDGEDAGLAYTMEHTKAVIGRGVGVQIQVRGEGVSRRHASLSRNAAGKVVLRDLGSSNGTFVNGTKIAQQELRSGDQIRIARGVVLEFRYEMPDERETLDLASKTSPRAVEGSLTATMVNLGRLHLSSGDFGKAAQSLTQALDKMRVYPSTPPDELAAVLADLAESKLGLGQVEEARHLAEESAQLAQRASANPRIAARAGFVLAQSMFDLDVVRARELAIAARGHLDDREPLARRIDEWLR